MVIVLMVNVVIVHGAIDNARCDAVHARGEGGGFAFLLTLCFSALSTLIIMA